MAYVASRMGQQDCGSEKIGVVRLSHNAEHNEERITVSPLVAIIKEPQNGGRTKKDCSGTVAIGNGNRKGNHCQEEFVQVMSRACMCPVLKRGWKFFDNIKF